MFATGFADSVVTAEIGMVCSFASHIPLTLDTLLN